MDCLEQEQEQVWLPCFASCQSCRGFVFLPQKNDIYQQHGVCGCFVALQMELAEQELCDLTSIDSDTALFSHTVRELAETLAREARWARLASEAAYHLKAKRAAQGPGRHPELAYLHRQRKDGRRSMSVGQMRLKKSLRMHARRV